MHFLAEQVAEEVLREHLIATAAGAELPHFRVAWLLEEQPEAQPPELPMGLRGAHL